MPPRHPVTLGAAASPPDTHTPGLGAAARALGAAKIYAIDSLPARLRQAERLGAQPVDRSQCDPVQVLRCGYSTGHRRCTHVCLGGGGVPTHGHSSVPVCNLLAMAWTWLPSFTNSLPVRSTGLRLHAPAVRGSEYLLSSLHHSPSRQTQQASAALV
jgi:threonine dehydrogenase-like Zn-dependent dehydrogenase